MCLFQSPPLYAVLPILASILSCLEVSICMAFSSLSFPVLLVAGLTILVLIIIIITTIIIISIIIIVGYVAVENVHPSGCSLFFPLSLDPLLFAHDVLHWAGRLVPFV